MKILELLCIFQKQVVQIYKLLIQVFILITQTSINIMPKHSNSLIEKAAKEDHSKLKKSSKQSKDIKKLLPIKKQQLRKIARMCQFKKYQNQTKINRDCKMQKIIGHQMIPSESLTCSICIEIIVGSALTQCGHMFCLNCIENVLFTSKHCPLCRSFMENQRLVRSKIFDKIISNYVNKFLNVEEIQNYEKRYNHFLQIQSKRQIRCKLYVGDILDYRVDMNWIAVRINQIEGQYIYLGQIETNICLDLSKPIHKQSRRLAKWRTFTQQPPLRPTYFSHKMNISNQTLNFIVQPPNYRPPIRYRPQNQNRAQNHNRPQNLANNEFNPSRWDQFEIVRSRNQWVFQDNQIPFRNNQNVWNIPNETDDFLLFY